MKTDKKALAHQDAAAFLLDAARRHGATDAKARVIEVEMRHIAVRNGVLDLFLHTAPSKELGLTVWNGKKVAKVSGSVFTRDTLETLARRACEMAQESTNDPYALLSEQAQWPKDMPQLVAGLELADPSPPPETRVLEDCAREADDALRSVAGVTRSEGAEVRAIASHWLDMSTKGFVGESHETSYSISAQAIAGRHPDSCGDYDSSSARFAADLRAPAAIGLKAGRRAVARLGARSMQTAQIPVVFSRRTAGGLLGAFLQAIAGENVVRGTFLSDKLGSQVFARGMNVIDNPHIVRGLGSQLCDDDDVASHRLQIVEDGMLKSWMLTMRSAAQLGMETTGHAGGPSNCYLEKGSVSRDELLGAIKRGFLVTETLGHGIQLVSGDYSLGAAGFLIENGEIAHPVKGVTIAGNLAEMFLHLTPADNLVFDSATTAPTMRVDGMTVAGK